MEKYDEQLEDTILEYLQSLEPNGEYSKDVSGHSTFTNGNGIYIILESRNGFKHKFVGWFTGTKDEEIKTKIDKNTQFKYLGVYNNYHLYRLKSDNSMDWIPSETKIFDGEYGITAKELHHRIIDDITRVCKHLGCYNQYVDYTITRESQHPIEQVISSILWQVRHQGKELGIKEGKTNET